MCPAHYNPAPRPEPAIRCTFRPAPIAKAVLRGNISVLGRESKTVGDPAPRDRIQKHFSLAPETHNPVHLYGMSLSDSASFLPIFVPLHCRTNKKIKVHRICEAPDQLSRVCEFSLPSHFPIPGSADAMPGDTHPDGLPRAEQSGSGVFVGADQGSACKSTQQYNTAQTEEQGP